MCADKDVTNLHLKNAIKNETSTATALRNQTGSSRLDCQKLIEQCDKEIAMIESEFDLLARKDFVDFVNQGS